MSLKVVGVAESTFHGFEMEAPANFVCLYYEGEDSCSGELVLDRKDVRDFAPRVPARSWSWAVGKSLSFRFDELGILQDLKIV